MVSEPVELPELRCFDFVGMTVSDSIVNRYCLESHMLEKVIPIILAIIALQFVIRFMQKNKKAKSVNTRNLDYKAKIDQFMKVTNYDEGTNDERILTDEIRSSLGKPDLLLEIPDSMREVRRDLNLIIDAVTHGVKSKISKNPTDEIKYNNPDKMMDEIVEIIKRHKMG